MDKLKALYERRKVLLWSLTYGMVMAWFLWVCSQFYLPGKGFTYLVMFGEHQSERYLPELKAINHYQLKDSAGYDAQFYAQIAMRPELGDPELKQAVDNLTYRARRILFSWTAHVLALGDPVRALHIYSVQNIVCWFLLAGLLLHWFPPNSAGNFIRWGGVMLSYGLCFSVRGSLVDGPSLLLIAAAMWLYEHGRVWSSAVMLGVAGLGKETNILAGTLLADPSARDWRSRALVCLRGAVVVLPLFIWMGFLKLWLDSGGGAGSRNFALPFTAYFTKWAATLQGLSDPEVALVARWSLLMLIAVSVQLLFMVFRPQWRQPWWRIGAAFALLMVFLGDAVWEDYPGAASRVLLPMGLAFNMLVPRGRLWLPVLLAGNLTVLSSPEQLQAPGGEGYRVSGAREYRLVPETGHAFEVHFDERWYGTETSRFEYWRWSSGAAGLTFVNPHPRAVRARIEFGLRSADERTVTVTAGDELIWTGSVGPESVTEVVIEDQRIEPGGTAWAFSSDRPSMYPEDNDIREVAFNIRSLRVVLEGWAEGR